MQYNIGYKLTNLLDVFIHTSGTVRRYEKVYERSIKLYKEIDNTFTLVVRNQDQKAQFVDGSTTVLQISDTDNKLKLTKVGVVVDDGSSTATKGNISFTITESDMLSLVAGYYHGAIKHTDSSGNVHLIYADTRYDAAVRFEVIDKTFPDLVDSTEINSFSYTANGHISSTVSANPNQNSNQALHTVAVYTNSFTGQVHVYGTMSTSVGFTSDRDEFYKITTQTYSSVDGDQYFNFTGIHQGVVFVIVENQGDSSTVLGGIDKILYRS